MSFEGGLSGLDDLLAELGAIGVTPTADQLRYLQDQQAWKDIYLEGYQSVLDDLAAVDMRAIDAAAVEALLAEPAYVEASDAEARIVFPAEGVLAAWWTRVRHAIGCQQRRIRVDRSAMKQNRVDGRR